MKSFLFKVGIRCLKILLWVLYRTQLYAAKTWIQRKCDWSARKNKLPVRHGTSLENLVLDTMDHPYTGDASFVLWDYAQAPERVEWLVHHERFLKPEECRRNFDCDEYAILHHTRIQKALKNKTELWYGGYRITDSDIVVIYWTSGEKLFAHHMCILQCEHKFFVCIDYLPSLSRKPQPTMNDALFDGVIRYGPNPKPVFRALLDENMLTRHIF